MLIASLLAAPLDLAATDGRISVRCLASLHEFDTRVGRFTGSLDPLTGRGRLQVEVASLSTGLGPRDSRMLYYALDVGTFPELAFVVDRLEGDPVAAGAGSGNLTLVGALTIRGTTRSVEVPARYTWEGEALRLTGRQELTWTDYGVPDPSVVLSTLSPELRVDFDVLARPPSPR